MTAFRKLATPLLFTGAIAMTPGFAIAGDTSKTQTDATKVKTEQSANHTVSTRNISKVQLAFGAHKGKKLSLREREKIQRDLGIWDR